MSDCMSTGTGTAYPQATVGYVTAHLPPARPLGIKQVANGYIILPVAEDDKVTSFKTEPHVFETIDGALAHIKKHFVPPPPFVTTVSGGSMDCTKKKAKR